MKRFVVFLDILGFKDIVEMSDKAFDILTIIENIIKDKRCMEKENAKDGYDKDFQITWFSDCIVFSYTSDDIENIIDLFHTVSNIQLTLITKEIVIRGAVTIGECYHKRQKLFGKAINKAYNLESKVAIAPRVVLDFDVIKFINQAIQDEESKLDELLEREIVIPENLKYFSTVEVDLRNIFKFVKKDKDGYYFIDYLSFPIDLLIYSYREAETLAYRDSLSMVETIKNLIETNVKKNNFDVLLKYLWLKDYYNTKIKNALITEELINEFNDSLIIK